MHLLGAGSGPPDQRMEVTGDAARFPIDGD